jgi:putative salt-induced outer membrane protein YdiY
MRCVGARSFAGTLLSLLIPATLAAQEPPPCPCLPPPGPPPVWTGSAGAGLGLTAGNTETRTLNLTFDVTRDARKTHVFKARALYLWGSENGNDTVNRLAFEARDEVRLTEKAFAFVQGQYLRDPFKAIDYLIAPTAGIGYKLIDTDRTKFSVDGGGGATWEKNPGLDVREYGAITAGEDLNVKLSPTATLTQAASALWKADDFGDALYTISAGLAAALTTRTSVNINLLDTFKTKPPTADIEKNDVALIVALAYKF